MHESVRRNLVTALWAAFAAVVVAGVVLSQFGDKGKLDVSTYMNELRNRSDLVTQELRTSGVLEGETEGIPYITQDSYIVKYTANVYASTDVDRIEINDSEENMTVILPHAVVHSVEIPPENIQYYDTGFTLIRSDKNETVNAQKAIKKEVLSEAERTGLLEEADRNAERIVRDSIAGIDSEKIVTVQFK
ncbi:MAG: DUF4230 domain-containing protein [Eubacterium sp.]|nr:DUF4230 domain-containing protein [Eubacterium sp.]